MINNNTISRISILTNPVLITELISKVSKSMGATSGAYPSVAPALINSVL
jgi:hypothetical protein